MKIKMHIQSLPRQVKFPIYAWHIISPPVQYLDVFRLDELDQYDADILAFEYILSRGRMFLSDIASHDNLLESLKSIQLNIPIKEAIKMHGVLRED